MTFQNTAIKCDTWEQMERLAELAKNQGYTASKWFTEDCFDDGDVFFEVDNDGVYDCFTIPIYTETTYTTFINSHPDISVEGVKKQDMKNFEPIVIQEETDVNDEMRIEPAIPDYDDVIDIVWSNEEGERIGLSHQAAIRLRDALNSILND